MKKYTKRDPNSYWMKGKALPEKMPLNVMKLVNMEWIPEDKEPKDWGDELHKWPKKIVTKGKFKGAFRKGQDIPVDMYRIVGYENITDDGISKEDITVVASCVRKVNNV
jgi:hypothetical protein